LTGDNNADDTISPNRLHSSSNSVHSTGGIILPPWQPDSDVAFCPVCANQFTFWYRKHHCRYVEPRTPRHFCICLDCEPPAPETTRDKWPV
jgi:hypothetical protein